MHNKLIKISKINVVSILFFFMVSPTNFADNDALKIKLDSLVEDFVKQEKFSGSVLVAKDGEILLENGYGMANYELEVPNTPQTKFRLGSISKQFTAMVIMQLQEQGLLNVQDTLSKYIAHYPHGDEITIHHLLTHTSGIPEITKFEDYKSEKIKPHNSEQLVEWLQDKPLDFPPGEKYKYSNSGYMLLSYIIEKVTGEKYETALNKYILDPLGMSDSGYDKSNTILKNRASGYRLVDNMLVNAEYIDMSLPTGAGALYSTILDLYRWDQALYSEKLLPITSIDEMFTAQSNTTNDNKDFPGYGYGWRTLQSKEDKQVGHSGRIEGFSADIRRYLDDKLVIIVLSNYENGEVKQVSKGLAAIVLEEANL